MTQKGSRFNLRFSPLSSLFTHWNAALTALRPTGVGILSVLLALSTTTSVLVVTAPNGIALIPDSVGYVAAARSLSAGNGLTLYDSSPLTIWAPLYPAVLALLKLISGLDPVEGARYINAGSFGLVVYFSGLLFQRRRRPGRCVCVPGIFQRFHVRLDRTPLHTVDYYLSAPS